MTNLKEQVAWKAKAKPTAYDLSDPDELRRLYGEVHGYLKVSLKDGTDREGRQFALDALSALLHPVEGSSADVVERAKSLEALTSALAGMLDAFGGYCTPEVDAAITAMQDLGLDRWSMQSRIQSTLQIPE